MPERTLTVRIVGDDSSLQRAFGRGSQGAQSYGVQVAGLGKNFLKAGVASAAAYASFQTVTTVLGDSIQNASDLNEEISKSEKIFGSSAESIQDWSKTTAEGIGQSRVEALRAAGTFGGLFKNMGFGEAVAADFSKTLVTLASDLASFNNADPSEVLIALRSGLAGEAEPLRRFNIFLTEARVQQEALIETGKRRATDLTQQEKLQARYNLILKDGAQANGDYKDTQEGLANQQRRLAAEFQDFETQLGELLIPAMTELTSAAGDAVEGLNDLFDILDKLGLLDVIKIAIELEVKFLTPGGPIREAKSLGEKIGNSLQEGVESILRGGTTGLRNIGAIFTGQGGHGWQFLPNVEEDVEEGVDKTKKDTKKVVDKTRELKREKEKEEKAWNEFVKGMGLKLSRAQITETETDDLAVLRELEAAILRRIARVGRTFKLVEQLIQVRGQIADTVASIAQTAQDKEQKAWDDALDALDLKLDIARTTKGFNDDMRILRQIETQILARIRAEGRTTDLLRQLFENRQAQKETLRNQRIADQFEDLGLTAEGERPTPSSAALLRRAKNLREQLKGTVFDTPKTRQELRRIVDFLKDHLHSAGREVRQAILDMLNDISSALDSGDKPKGPLTKFAKTGIGKLIAGLGLTEEQVRELRARMSAVGPGLSVPAKGTGAFGFVAGGGAQVGPARGPREGDFVFHIYIDGQPVEATVTRRQQKKQGRNGRSRRGTRPGR